jgi:hypothetical protein
MRRDAAARSAELRFGGVTDLQDRKRRLKPLPSGQDVLSRGIRQRAMRRNSHTNKNARAKSGTPKARMAVQFKVISIVCRHPS